MEIGVCRQDLQARRPPHHGGVRVLALVTLVLLASLSACNATGPERLESLEVTHAATVSEGLPFPVTVTAVGSRGTKPFRSFSGPVALAAEAGLLTVVNGELSSGVGVLDTSIVAVEGSSALRVSAGGLTVTSTLTVEALTELPGDPGSAAEAVLPWIPFVPLDGDYRSGSADAPGWQVAVSTLGLAFRLGVSVAEANAVLRDIGARIVGVGPGRAGEVEAVLMARVGSTTHEELAGVVATLVADDRVLAAAPDVVLVTPDVDEEVGAVGPAFVPPGAHPDWDIESPTAEGSWGVRVMRLPQAWNLMAGFEKAGNSVRVGVIDSGVDAGHEDLVVTEDLTATAVAPDEHGTHVAGIIAARSDDETGIDGVNPVAKLVTKSADSVIAGDSTILLMSTWGTSMINDLVVFSGSADVGAVNVSLGYPLYPDYTRGDSVWERVIVSQQGRLMKTRLLGLVGAPIVVVAAGNESREFGYRVQPAQYASPMANAAIEHGYEGIIVVEALDQALTRRESSNVGGLVSAPGADILSTVPGNAYKTKSGTSMAAPYVTGLVSLLLLADPGLDAGQIRELLSANARETLPHPVHGGQPSGLVDAFASLLDIDRVRGDVTMLTMLLDIDDGTLDGNRRVDPVTGAIFTDEDADGDGGIADGVIDMADFRRWRDWYLQVSATSVDALLALDLDGPSDHPKKDVNGNGRVGTPAEEGRFPRGDFNGDGQLSLTARSYVPGAIDASVTDLEVLMWLFEDPHYAVTDLEDLVESLDVEVWPSLFLGRAEVVRVRSSVHVPGGGVAEEREHLGAGVGVAERQMYTLPKSLFESGFVVKVEGFDAGGAVVLEGEETFSAATGFRFKLGADHFVDPLACPTASATARTVGSMTSKLGDTCIEQAPHVHLVSSHVYQLARANAGGDEETIVGNVEDVTEYSDSYSATASGMCGDVDGYASASSAANYLLHLEPDFGVVGLTGQIHLDHSHDATCGSARTRADWTVEFEVRDEPVLLKVDAMYGEDPADDFVRASIIVFSQSERRDVVTVHTVNPDTSLEHILTPGSYRLRTRAETDKISAPESSQSLSHAYEIRFEAAVD